MRIIIIIIIDEIINDLYSEDYDDINVDNMNDDKNNDNAVVNEKELLKNIKTSIPCKNRQKNAVSKKG